MILNLLLIGKIKPIERDYNAPLIIASFDIECNSIDGQFHKLEEVVIKLFRLEQLIQD